MKRHSRLYIGQWIAPAPNDYRFGGGTYAIAQSWARALLVLVCASALMLALSIPSAVQAQSVPITSDLRLWLDANDVYANGTAPANGTAIGQWHDKSGHGHLITDSGTVDPIYEAAGLGGLPSIRLASKSGFAGPNIFSASTNPETTIFLVQEVVARTTNFALNLNGTNTGGGRFSLHIPWSNGWFYFDAGGCCGATRVYGRYPINYYDPHMTTAGNSTTGYSGYGSYKQFVRHAGLTSANDTTAIAPVVTGGFRLGSQGRYYYNGRFSEVLIYDRALSLSEIEEVECYLADKWQIDGPASCNATPVTIQVEKSHSPYTGNTFGDFAIPGNEQIYKLSVEHDAGDAFDTDSLFLVDSLPSNLTFYNGDLDGASGPFTDPVGFTNSGSGLTFNPASGLRYSDAASPPAVPADCTYTPTSGYDPNVRHICVEFGGDLLAGKAELFYRTKLE